jgi:hypothetical protein
MESEQLAHVLRTADDLNIFIAIVAVSAIKDMNCLWRSECYWKRGKYRTWEPKASINSPIVQSAAL